jgi:hypothetical protein
MDGTFQKGEKMLGRREELEREAGAVEEEEKELWGEATRLDHRKQDIIRQDKGTNTQEETKSLFYKVRLIELRYN